MWLCIPYRNPGFPTIEEELIQALHKCQLITDEQREVISKARFQRCARTDKGVSAARQAVSIKISILSPNTGLVDNDQLLLHFTWESNRALWKS